MRKSESRLFSAHSIETYSHRIIQDFLSIEPLRELEIKYLEHWLNEFEIGQKIEFENYEGISMGLYLFKDGKRLNLMDLGVGSNQILPILLNIIIHAHKSYRIQEGYLHFLPNSFIIEEPESNLHPNLQSKIADMLIDAAYKFNIQFIVETHSEYFIRKLQYWTAKRILKPEDTIIYYFTNPGKVKKDEKQVKRIEITQDGSLTDDFGPGFFDEAINWQFELLRIKSSQKN